LMHSQMESKAPSPRIVYVRPKLYYFHKTPQCSFLKGHKYKEIEESKAIRKGYERCNHCFYKNSNGESLSYVVRVVNLNVTVHFNTDILPKNKLKEKEEMDTLHFIYDIRGRIACNDENKYHIYMNIHAENIREEIHSILKPSRIDILREIIPLGIEITPEELCKFALLHSLDMEWSEIIKTLRRLYPQGIFQDYNFEDAVFIIFLSLWSPGSLYKKYHSERYKAESKFYVDCLAGSIQKWSEEIWHIRLPNSGSEVKGNTLAEKIIYSYWELYGINGTPLEKNEIKDKED